jgi:phosphate transport system substrate-binding protein
VAEFLKYILSRDGQEVVVKDGYLPIKAKKQAGELEKVGSSTPK